MLRENNFAGQTVTLSSTLYQTQTNPEARRLYRLMEESRE
jgi:hypothetical protein